MRHFIPGPLPDNARNVMRRVGYAEHIGHGGAVSYAKRIQRTPYPRFHAYVEEMNGGMQINFHLDQKIASYEGSHAHSGEYEGPTVEREMRRILELVSGLSGETQPQTQPEKKNSWWKLLIG